MSAVISKIESVSSAGRWVALVLINSYEFGHKEKADLFSEYIRHLLLKENMLLSVEENMIDGHVWQECCVKIMKKNPADVEMIDFTLKSIIDFCSKPKLIYGSLDIYLKNTLKYLIENHFEK